jgi:trehalose synthase
MDAMFDAYAKLIGQESIDQLYQIAHKLRGLKVVHVNSTYWGGGVAEILAKMVPLMKALGIDTDWQVINGNPDFFQCTKYFHNCIQGQRHLISAQLLRAYEQTNVQNAENLRSHLQDADVVLIHDPQPLSLIDHFPKRRGKWIWRCHIDASNPQRTVWKYLQKFMAKYDASIFSLADFAQPLPHPIYLIPPSIDPLSEKNRDLSPEEVNAVYNEFNIDPSRPMILQVSRFDRFKDPLGVIEAYKLAKKYKPSLQLVLAGGGAADDPESEAVLNEVKAAAAEDSSIHVLFLPSDAHRTINALQRAAQIVLQKSIKEGFGLTVTEAMWKAKPVIGGNTGGIRLQVVNHYTGFLVNTPEGAAHRIRYLLQNPQRMEEMGIRGKQFAKENFLITRHLREYLTVIATHLGEEAERIEFSLGNTQSVLAEVIG